MIWEMLAIWSLDPLPFLSPTWPFGSSQLTYSWSLAWRIFSITLLACEQNFLALPFFGIRMKTDFFQSCGHCWVFQICWHIECSTFTASSLGFEIAQLEFHHLLALFVVMLPKAYLTSHSRMSGSRWVTTSSWLAGSLRPFCTVLCILVTSS